MRSCFVARWLEPLSVNLHFLRPSSICSRYILLAIGYKSLASRISHPYDHTLALRYGSHIGWDLASATEIAFPGRKRFDLKRPWGTSHSKMMAWFWNSWQISAWSKHVWTTLRTILGIGYLCYRIMVSTSITLALLYMGNLSIIYKWSWYNASSPHHKFIFSKFMFHNSYDSSNGLSTTLQSISAP